MKLTHYFIAIAAVGLYIFVPTSFDGVMLDVSQIIILWALSAVFIISFCLVNEKDYTNAIILIGLMTSMSLATWIANYFDMTMRFSVARVAPVLCLMVLCISIVRTTINFKVLLFVFELSLITMSTWGFAILLENSMVADFTINYYSQFYDIIVPYMVAAKKPVISFGIYTFASFFYMLNFLMCYRVFQSCGYRRFLWYMMLLFVMNLLLFSSTSLCFSLVMLFLFNKVTAHIGQKVLLWSIVLVAVFILCSSYDVFSLYSEHLAKDANGFRGRYGAVDSAFGANFELIGTYPLGIGFCIAGNPNVRYTDCGYIVYATMGGILGTLLIYYMMYRFLRNNLTKKDLILFLLIIFMFEFALAAMIYVKFFFFAIFLVYFMRSLDSFVKNNKLIQ